jgi:hypothetical protein
MHSVKAKKNTKADLTNVSFARKRTRGACKFKQCDVIRAVNAVAKAGVPITRIEISPDGKIVIATGPDTQQGDDLDHELAEFEARKK